VEVEETAPPTGIDVDGIAAPYRLVRELDPEGSLAAALPRAHSIAVVPLESDDERLGIVVAEWGRDRGRIPASTLGALTHAASRGAQTLRNQTVVAEIARLATRDPLTGLANRRVFDGELRRELERARRTGEPLTLVLLDADRFKDVNDRYGHAQGDRVLQSIASALTSRTKGFDVVARVGGEEFAALLPGCDADFAAEVAARLRADPEPDDQVVPTPVTLSAGWASWPDHATTGADLFAAADQALYAAKRSGRARVGAPEPYIDLTAGAEDAAPVDLLERRNRARPA
jgi:diguanylate cyclase (GGDEF)-like protein